MPLNTYWYIAFLAVIAVGTTEGEPEACNSRTWAMANDTSALLQKGLLRPDGLVLNGVQSDLQQGLALQADFERYAATLPEGATKELLRSFKICGSCNNFRRFGEPHDGGYLMCMDHMDGVTAAYSRRRSAARQVVW